MVGVMIVFRQMADGAYVKGRNCHPKVHLPTTAKYILPAWDCFMQHIYLRPNAHVDAGMLLIYRGLNKSDGRFTANVHHYQLLQVLNSPNNSLVVQFSLS